jgi:uncharacterized protein YndB with AHSA1/START domain
MLVSDHPIIVEQSFDASAQEVWEAITQQDQMIQWFFENIESFIPQVGFKTQFVVHSEERTFTHLWEIIEVEPLKKIVYDWRYKEYSGAGNVVFELISQNGGTKLSLSNLVIENFPQDVPEFKRESCIGGWDYFIKDRLKTYLEN